MQQPKITNNTNWRPDYTCEKDYLKLLIGLKKTYHTSNQISTMSKRAVILAGGKGTRLKPYTVNIPKPLVPIGDMPILEIIIRQLAKAGFDHITLTVNHLAELIRTFCGDGSKWEVKIDYSLESKPLSTMGPLKLIDDLPEKIGYERGCTDKFRFLGFFEEHVKEKYFYHFSFTREQKECSVLKPDVQQSDRFLGKTRKQIQCQYGCLYG